MLKAATELDPAHEDALRRLGRLFRSPGGRLVFAVGADDRIRAAVASALGTITLIELAGDEPAPWTRLDDVDAQALLVVLPRSCPQELLQRLNVGRERVVRLGLKLVLWLRELETMDGVRLAAPDLWAHRAGWLTFLSEADLPISNGPLPVSPREQLADLEQRIATWPAYDKVGRFHAESNAVLLLAEIGRREEARQRAQALEGRWRRMHWDEREQCRKATEQVGALAVPPRAPHLKLKDERGRLLHASAYLVNSALVLVPRLENSLGFYSDYAASLQRPVPPQLNGPDDVGWAVNRAALLADYFEDRADIDGLDRSLKEIRPAFTRFPEGARERQEARFGVDIARFHAQRAWQVGDWLESMRLVHAAALTADQSGADYLLDLLAFGQQVARDAGLTSIAAAWFDRATLLAHDVGLDAMARWLATALDNGSLSPSQTVTARSKALALAGTIEDLGLASSLLAAAGRSGAPDEARRELQHRMRRHGYPRFAAASELAALELDLGKGEAAAEAATAALDYAHKHGGPGLQADLWLDIATGHRLARRWDRVDTSLTEVHHALGPLDHDLLPAATRLRLAQVTGALHQARDHLAEADTALWAFVDLMHSRGARLREHEALLSACRFGGPRRSEAGHRSLELGIELGLPALEARSWLELAALSQETGILDAHAAERATWWIERIGNHADRRRLSEVLSSPPPAPPPPPRTPARAR